MKKLFILCSMMLLALVAWATETTTTLHNEAWTCSDGWSGYVQIDNTAATTYAAGDKILVTVTENGGVAEWPQIKVQYSDADWVWQNFDDADGTYTAGLWYVEEYPYTAEFELTEAMVTKINAGKALIVTGCDYTGSKVEWIHNEEDPTGDITLWEGEKTMGNDWGPDDFIMLEANKFTSATAGSTLIVHVTALGSGASGNGVCLQNGSWSAFNPSLDCWLGEVRNAEFILTQAVLDEIASTNGLVVKGVNYTTDKIVLRMASPATAMEQVEASATTKKMVLNGQVVIVREGVYYNVQGQIIR